MSSAELDLRQLARERPARPGTSPPRRKLARLALPAALLAGLAALLAYALRDQLLASTPVTVVPVVLSRAEVQRSGTVLFQAAGWIEPRPSAVLASALVDGVIDKIHVVAGQPVAAGEPLATLVDIDARLALEQAENQLALRQSEVDSATAALEAAQARYDRPLHLDAALAEAEAGVSQTETLLKQVPFLLSAARAKLDLAEKNLVGKEAAGEALAGRLLQQARTEREAAISELHDLESRQPQLERQHAAWHRRFDAAKQQREQLVEEKRALDDATALLQSAEIRVRQARLEVRQAQLHLERTVIQAPIGGTVLEVLAKPGTRVTGLAGPGEQSSRAVVSLYDPAELQARVDVRLEDVRHVTLGQEVRIESTALKQPLKGHALRPTSNANIQKNTLEVKVAVENPPAILRPEMLISATFLAPETSAKPSLAASLQQRLLAPRELIEGSGSEARVWIVSADNRAEQRPVTLGAETDGGLVEVTQGLVPTDRLIVQGRERLSPGERIQISAEDATLGMRGNAQP